MRLDMVPFLPSCSFIMYVFASIENVSAYFNHIKLLMALLGNVILEQTLIISHRFQECKGVLQLIYWSTLLLTIQKKTFVGESVLVFTTPRKLHTMLSNQKSHSFYLCYSPVLLSLSQIIAFAYIVGAETSIHEHFLVPQDTKYPLRKNP